MTDLLANYYLLRLCNISIRYDLLSNAFFWIFVGEYERDLDNTKIAKFESVQQVVCLCA